MVAEATGRKRRRLSAKFYLLNVDDFGFITHYKEGFR
jgi:hypothetical protein